MGALSALGKLAVFGAVLAVAVRVWQGSRQKLPPVSGGFARPEYKPVADLFRKYVDDGTERGGSFAVYHKGEPLVNLWGGYADPESYRPWRDDTMSLIFSTTKGLSALVIAMLVDRGLLDYKTEVYKYWPEFGQAGKKNITLEMLVSHRGGMLSLGGKSITTDEYRDDWKKVEGIMAAAVPDFPPGQLVSYHALTFAMYLDAIVRRVDPQHRNLSTFFHDEVAGPFDIDLHIGLPKRLAWRVARQVEFAPWRFLALLLDPQQSQAMRGFLSGSSLLAKAVVCVSNFIDRHGAYNDPNVMEVGIGSAIGFGSGAGVARLYSILAAGGQLEGKQLLSRKLVDALSKPTTLNTAQGVAGFGFQFALGHLVAKNVKGDVIYGHPGHGGQQGMADPKAQLGFGYVTNHLWPVVSRRPAHYDELERVFYECHDRAARKNKA